MYVNLHYSTFPALCKHKTVLTTTTNCGAYNFPTNRQKCAIFLQTCQGNIYYFERHITVESSTNPFSVLFSTLFPGPDHVLVICHQRAIHVSVLPDYGKVYFVQVCTGAKL